MARAAKKIQRRERTGKTHSAASPASSKPRKKTSRGSAM
jgi:hypothetical protein